MTKMLDTAAAKAPAVSSLEQPRWQQQHWMLLLLWRLWQWQFLVGNQDKNNDEHNGMWKAREQFKQTMNRTWIILPHTMQHETGISWHPCIIACIMHISFKWGRAWCHGCCWSWHEQVHEKRVCNTMQIRDLPKSTGFRCTYWYTLYTITSCKLRRILDTFSRNLIAYIAYHFECM